jgi:soluble lytic murein transglycosylase
MNRSFLFFSLFTLCFGACAQSHVQSGFYRGLLIRAEQQDVNVVRYFENALSSSNVYVRQAAAEELANLMFEGTELSAKTAARVRREVSGYWAAAFDAVDNASDKKKVLSFLLGFEQGSAYSDEVRLFILRECEKQGIFFSENEIAAIEGHFAVSRSRYIEALDFFRAFQEDEKWPAHIPELFIEYPNLINDLGRAFQYTVSDNEGIELFLTWDRNPDGNADDLRYRLLFYAARIARRRGNEGRALSLFEQARHLAPDAEQLDACIWYILDLSVNEASGVFIERLEQFIPYWHNDSYFEDVLEKFLQRLTMGKEWEKMINVFSLIKDRGAVESKAGYAWIIARVIEEGYVSQNEIELALQEVNVTENVSAAFMKVAYDAGHRALYYRHQSAAALGQPFLESLSETRTGGRADKNSPVLEFLLGFFKNNAEALSRRYIAAVEKELSPDELRTLAQAFAKADLYAQSIRLVSQYIYREDYTPLKRDMELWFPRPYREIVEKYAEEIGFSPALLFGLIRTESAFQSGVISRAGAVGLTQLMPETAQEMAGRIRRTGGPDYASGENGLDLSDPEQNIHIGTYYLNYLNVRFEDILLSLLAYNGGMTRVRRLRAANTMPVDIFIETVPVQETRDYGRKVMAAAAVYEELYYRQNR